MQQARPVSPLQRPGNMGFDRASDPDEARLFAELNGLEPAMSGDSIGSLSGSSKSGMSALEYLQRTAFDAQVSTDTIKRALKGTKTESTLSEKPTGIRSHSFHGLSPAVSQPGFITPAKADMTPMRVK